MAERRYLVHTVAEDRGQETRDPRLGHTGQAVSGFATFYHAASGWTKITPGRLELRELWGGASGFGNNLRNIQQNVEFYIGATPNDQYVALNGDRGEVFSFGFFGRRHS